MTVLADSRPHPSDGDPYSLWYTGAFAALFTAYVIVFLATTSLGLWGSVTSAAANIAPPAILGLTARPALRRLAGLSRVRWLAALCLGAVVFSLAWYGLLAVTLGLSMVLSGQGFELVFISGPGLVWQMYQGLLTFALLFCATALHDLAPRANRISEVRAVQTMLVRTEDGLVPIEPAELIAIEADDDASHIVLRNRRLRTNTTLAAWAEQLDHATFVRVHRSWIINLKSVHSVEPVGGGRMIVHLPNGLSAPVSRSGARSLRARAN